MPEMPPNSKTVDLANYIALKMSLHPHYIYRKFHYGVANAVNKSRTCYFQVSQNVVACKLDFKTES
jgi:hypothetical protein